jgi:3-hydroxyacyl-CoA dehydrogenase
VIDTLKVSLMMKEVMTELVHVASNDMPGFLEERIVEPIWARGLIRR